MSFGLETSLGNTSAMDLRYSRCTIDWILPANQIISFGRLLIGLFEWFIEMLQTVPTYPQYNINP